MEGMESRTRRLRAMIGGLLLVLLAAAAASCKVAGVDVNDRMEAFAAALNAPDPTRAAYASLNSNFDQALTQDLQGLPMDAAFWTTNFPAPPDADHSYTITLLSYSDPANVSALIMGPPVFNSNTGTARTARFVMSREGLDWVIRELDLGGIGVLLPLTIQ